ncbi:MAG: cell division protein FtsA [Acidobacteriota bacterium]
MKKKWLTAGIDIGTTKICSTIAQIEDERIEILGTGWSPSHGLRRGMVVNLSETIESIKSSLEKAEAQSQTIVESAYVSIGGAYIRGINRSGQTEIRGKNGEVTPEDIDRAVAAAKSFDLHEDYEIIHVLTQHYTLDGQEGITNPLGMNGRKLSVHLHVVANASAVVQNIVSSVNKAGVVVSGVVMQQLASAEAILDADEKEMGSIVVDIGGGTTDIAVYAQGGIQYSEVLPLGGNMITRDIAIGLKTPLNEAENLKKNIGSVYPESIPPEEVIEISEVGTGRRRTVSRHLLCQIIQARCDEVLKALCKVIRNLGMPPDLMTGLVLTGGGSLLDGFADRAEECFGMPVRIGYPINVVSADDEVFHPSYCTGLGLLSYALTVQGTAAAGASAAIARTTPARERMKNWLLEKIS